MLKISGLLGQSINFTLSANILTHRYIDTHRSICAVKVQVRYVRTHTLSFVLDLCAKVLVAAEGATEVSSVRCF